MARSTPALDQRLSDSLDPDLDVTAETFSDRLTLYRSHQEPSTPLVHRRDNHIYIYQDTKEPLILTENQFVKLARNLGVL